MSAVLPRPDVTIVTPTLNSATTVLDTLESVRDQTCVSWEHIIVDGLSSDHTIPLVERARDSRVRVIAERDHGLYDAMNKGIRAANGDVIGVLNSDDVLACRDVLQTVCDAFDHHGADVVYGDVELVNANDLSRVVRRWHAGVYRTGSFRVGWHPPHPGVYVKRSVYETFGLYDLRYRIAADFELLLRFFERYQLRVVYVPIVFTKMRIGGVSTGSLRNVIRGNLECMEAFRQNSMRVPVLYPALRLLPKLRQYITY